MTLKKYKVHNVSDALSSGSLESMAAKRKNWFIPLDGSETLFKVGRAGTGENWAEKVTCELADLLEIPHAFYDLAYIGEEQCVISPNFLKKGEELIFGKQLIEGFDDKLKFKNIKHTLKAIFDALNKYDVKSYKMEREGKVVKEAKDLFVGYMCFDAWVGNTDRHAENWGIITKVNHPNVLAPTFDHASSLGRNESDEKRVKRLHTKDTGFNVQAYVQRAKTPIYDEKGQMLSTLSLVKECRKYALEPTLYWLGKISDLMNDSKKITQIFYRIPDDFITEPARNFAMAMLTESIEKLRELKND